MAYTPRKKPPKPWVPYAWERATLPPGPLPQGLLPHHLAQPVFFILAGALMIAFNATLGLWGVPVALVLARLTVFDLAAYTLPDVYTVPLIATGAASAWLAGQGASGLITPAIVLPLIALALWLGPKYLATKGVGGGDLKLLAAMALWLSPLHLCLAVAAGCLMYLPFTFRRPLAPVPLGVPLILGWVLVLLVF